MRRGKPSVIFFVFAAISFMAVSGHAEVQLQKIEWRLAKKTKGRPPRYETLSALKLEGENVPGRLLAKLTLFNRGPQPEEGILLRYSVAARLAPKNSSQGGIWAVSFMLDERRIPKLGANQVQEVPLELPMLGLYLIRIFREGFKPLEIKIQVMLEPRQGQTMPIKTLESILALGS